MVTLNLCLRVPEKMHKTRDESDPSRLRKLPKTAPKPQIFADFLHFLYVFSVRDDKIDFLSFASAQAPLRHTFKTFFFAELRGFNEIGDV